MHVRKLANIQRVDSPTKKILEMYGGDEHGLARVIEGWHDGGISSCVERGTTV